MLTPAQVILMAAHHICVVGHARHFLQSPPPHLGDVPEEQRPKCMYGAVQWVIRTQSCRFDWWRACAALDDAARARGWIDKHRQSHAGSFNDDARNSAADVVEFMRTVANAI